MRQRTSDRCSRNAFFSSVRLAFGCIVLVSLASAQQGSIAGFVVDPSGGSVAQAQVKYSNDAGGPGRETFSSAEGTFTVTNVPPGAFHLTFIAKGFSPRTVTDEVHPGEALTLATTSLVVDTVNTEVDVTQTQAEIGETQIKVAETQRLGAILPNFFVTYDKDAVPLTVKQKAELTWKTYLDPSSFVVNGIIAGVWQAKNDFKGFGQGGMGYAKRYGASFADYGTNLVLEKVVFSTAFKEDPRYFYKGTGSTRSRIFYAITRSMVCRSDTSQKDRFCYSTFASRFATGFLTNQYYPAADRSSSGTVLANVGIGIGADALGNLFQEFIAKKITTRKP